MNSFDAPLRLNSFANCVTRVVKCQSPTFLGQCKLSSQWCCVHCVHFEWPRSLLFVFCHCLCHPTTYFFRRQLKTLFEAQSQRCTTEAFTDYMNHVMNLIFEMLKSQRTKDNLAGVLAIDALLQVRPFVRSEHQSKVWVWFDACQTTRIQRNLNADDNANANADANANANANADADADADADANVNANTNANANVF